MKNTLLAALLLLPLAAVMAADAAKVDPKYPFRTDWANAHLPWYQLKTGEFPPHHSDRRIGGELVEVDYIHRAGRFRLGNGELVNFTMPPFGTVSYLNAEADLRDVPLGTFFLFFLNQDEQGGFTRLATMQDEYTMLAGHGFTYRVDDVKLGEGKLPMATLKVTKQKLAENKLNEGRNELFVNGNTRIWKGEQQVKPGAIAVGDALLVSLGGNATKGPGPRWCTDIFIGADTHKLVSEKQRKKHTQFIRERGVPAWIDHVDGRKLTVTLFASEPASLRGLFKDEGVDPAQWAKEHRHITVVVANEHLRSYWPPVTNRGANVLELQNAPTDCYGCSGVRWVIEVDSLLEGFRVGRNLRLFVHPSWPVKDMPFGEGLHEGGHDFEEPPEAREEEPADYPFRTDFGNPHLPWYQLKPGQFPPPRSEHQIIGDLMQVDASTRSGQFRNERTGELVHFTLPPFGTVMRLNAEADLSDLPLGTRCRFLLHQDTHGAFTIASVVLDEYTWLARNTVTYRLEAARLDEGRLFVGHEAAPVKVDYQLEPHKPPYLGRTMLGVDAQTRVWKGDQQIQLGELAANDQLLINLTGGSATNIGRCTDIWVGPETHQQATGKKRAHYAAGLKERGLPAWIESVDGRKVTIIFFAGDRDDFNAVLSGDPWGKPVFAVLADENLHGQGAVLKAGFANHLPEGATFGNPGCSGVRWVIEPEQVPEGWRPGQVVRVFKEGWPLPAAGGAATPAK